MTAGEAPGGEIGGKRGPLFWASAVAGWAIIAFGVRGALLHRHSTKPTDLARFFLAGVVFHDLLFAPLVLAIAFALTRLVPGRWRASAQVALFTMGCAALFSWPEVRDYARVNHNPSSLPFNYTANLLIVAAVVTATTIAVTVVRHHDDRGGGRPPPQG